ncbi:hypothetical protein OEG86_20690 [Hoeflea alexandrii]|uniref:DnaT-like ssDNA-binding protein n=1 Tax=Hoeflea alexandrii TaxID=288436 RepID=UPI00226EC6E5|nr:DnaT-like ssDNA-binding protein [Hoeflea alexandrii]MCY0154248.1 hypothetical protein [Hoeflea alexandrii]
MIRQRGSSYVDAVYGGRFVGDPTDPVTQERSWPRIGAFAYGVEIGSDAVPDAVIKASYHAALAAATSDHSLSLSTPAAVKRRKVGDVEVEFAEAAATFQFADDVPVSVLDGLLAPLLRSRTGVLIRTIGA